VAIDGKSSAKSSTLTDKYVNHAYSHLIVAGQLPIISSTLQSLAINKTKKQRQEKIYGELYMKRKLCFKQRSQFKRITLRQSFVF
jgi:hypothetical protein